jgi:hypothetical protein
MAASTGPTADAIHGEPDAPPGTHDAARQGAGRIDDTEETGMATHLLS